MLFPYFMLQPYAEIKISSPSLILNKVPARYVNLKNLSELAFLLEILRKLVFGGVQNPCVTFQGHAETYEVVRLFCGKANFTLPITKGVVGKSTCGVFHVNPFC